MTIAGQAGGRRCSRRIAFSRWGRSYAGAQEPTEGELAGNLSAQLKKKRAKQNEPAPGKDTVCKAKKRLGWKLHKVKAKPKLSDNLLRKRLQMAKERMMSTDKYYISKNARTVFADEKWFSEERGTLLQFEARKESPVPANIRFKGKDAKAHTQRMKIMFMLCVTSTTPIGMYELDFKEWNHENDAKTLA